VNTRTTSLIIAALLGASVACSNAQSSERKPARASSAPATVASANAPTAAASTVSSGDETRYRDAARAAWTYMEANYQRSTGLVNASPSWANTTTWDIGAQLLAFYSARGIGLVDSTEYDQKIRTTLASLERAPLFRGIAFTKTYSTKTGEFGEGGGRSIAATDLGRLLVALKVIATNQPQYVNQIARIVKRIDFSKIVSDGYLHGQMIGSNGKPWVFQEGRVGYEQYSARGFSEWGANVGNALDLKKNSAPVTVYGVPLLKDTRFQDRLLSEPFILYGLELGMPAEIGNLASNVLRAQQARFDSTGTVTIASEDASSTPPYYFYYYCVYCDAKPFVVGVAEPGKDLDAPRWVSTKAAFGWNAIMPSDYTQKALDRVAPALDAKRGWAAGVTESTGTPVQAWDINTAAVVLESAYYVLRGRVPLISTSATSATGMR
jgi:hypothetical protein